MTQAVAAQALSISRELTDTRAERAVLRLLARGYRAVRPNFSLSELHGHGSLRPNPKSFS